ncbi:uncharacterized protein LOC119389978 isoform X8 [Rhipicephalus sanguineus]|uniref:uncharacterized protein LOC119389978 isoform X8 n=1 Tax=Rhipicephalus sanguineus TaxID=34632 RepID=UPI0020C5A4FD|nr:uncharacterized protein LOC119389978 isoform X8 [Rhipicephalus sanguineus]
MFSSVPRCACSAQFNFLTIPWINPFQVQVYGATNAEEEQAVRASRCIYSVLLQLLMWSFHVVPKAVTGLLPLVDGPLLGIMTTGSIAPEYLSEARGDPKRVSPVRRHSDSLGQHRQCRSSSLAEDVGHTADQQHGRNVAVGWFSGNATVDARRRSRLPGSFSHLLLLLLRLEPVAVRAQRSGGERCRADGGQDTTETSEHAYTWENQATAMEAEALRQLRCINVPYALRRICAVRLSRRLMVGMTIKVVLIASVLLFTSTTGPLLPALANAVDVHTLTSKSTTAMPAVNYSFLSY